MELELRPTNLCQLRCDHCYISDFLQGKKILWGVDEITRVVNFCSALVGELSEKCFSDELSVRITGGEPLYLGVKLLSFLVEQLYSKIKFVNLGIVSNFLLYNSDVGKLARDFNLLLFTSYDPDVRFHNPELERLWIRKVSQALDEGLDVIVSVVLTRVVIERGFSLIEFLRNLGFRKIYFAPFSPFGRGRNVYSYLCAKREEVVEYFKALLLNVKDIHILPFGDIKRRYFDFLFRGYARLECWSDCYNDFGINPDLTVTSVGLCFEKCVYGKITDSLRESVDMVISSPNRASFMKAKLFSNPECFKCEYYGFCRGGCFSFGYHPFDTECRGLKSLLDFALKEMK